MDLTVSTISTYFVRNMTDATSLGSFEQLVLTAVVALGDDAYSVSVHEKVELLSKPKKVSLGAVYATLDRLEDKGLLASWLAEPTPERGGRSKRHYRLEPAGRRALRESLATSRRMLGVIDDAWGGSPWPGSRTKPR